jgi:hypothetical protein
MAPALFKNKNEMKTTGRGGFKNMRIATVHRRGPNKMLIGNFS